MHKNNKNTLVAKTLRQAAFRIALVSISAGAVSYYLNHSSIEEAVRKQLLLSTEQTLQRESLPFREIKDLHRNFLKEFEAVYRDPAQRSLLIADFDRFFYQLEDGSYRQRPGLFEGQPLADHRRFPKTSATYAPDIPPDDDTKARLALTYRLAHHYGSSTEGRLFNFYGMLPEKGFAIHQSVDVAKAYTYTGPEAFHIETYEFFYRSFGSPSHETMYTRMYYDMSNHTWMTTMVTPDIADAAGKHKVVASVDVLLDELMHRTAKPMIQGSYSTLFQKDIDGTLIYHPRHTETIKRTQGMATIRSLKLMNEFPLLEASQNAKPGAVRLIKTENETVALGQIPETPWILTVHYPHSLMRPAIMQNLAVVIALGLLTLLVEIFIIRSILQEQVARPLMRLMQAMRQMGTSGNRPDSSQLPVHSQDEIGEVAREFAVMAKRVHLVQDELERKVAERTAALEEANQTLIRMSSTDDMTGLANRRRLDEVLDQEWKRALREEKPLSLAMIDVDWFKKYNDHYGHLAGDRCLQRIAAILQTPMHRAGDLVARYGGEEFAMVLPNTTLENALHVATLLCRVVEEACIPHAHAPAGRITISIGVASLTPHKDIDLEDLLREADLALYRAKELGRNRIETIRLRT